MVRRLPRQFSEQRRPQAAETILLTLQLPALRIGALACHAHHYHTVALSEIACVMKAAHHGFVRAAGAEGVGPAVLREPT